ncbi:uncharacterized protein LY89DRAFT_716001 [Mollisia scopiformis]|uniref:Uncharacterized protein n=1 Tax=Mollisia scopiformis TaxID=149040 RepID=A0A194XKH3_MOLSC|nr:uncharacterized protein LY89DRAFT_716001 [Mollisia scopiformis]KUJ20641.1 hypothetical protein LY89DRAFT_716001 [Mollisia scopiformis]
MAPLARSGSESDEYIHIQKNRTLPAGSAFARDSGALPSSTRATNSQASQQTTLPTATPSASYRPTPIAPPSLIPQKVSQYPLRPQEGDATPTLHKQSESKYTVGKPGSIFSIGTKEPYDKENMWKYDDLRNAGGSTRKEYRPGYFSASEERLPSHQDKSFSSSARKEYSSRQREGDTEVHAKQRYLGDSFLSVATQPPRQSSVVPKHIQVIEKVSRFFPQQSSNDESSRSFDVQRSQQPDTVVDGPIQSIPTSVLSAQSSYGRTTSSFVGQPPQQFPPMCAEHSRGFLTTAHPEYNGNNTSMHANSHIHTHGASSQTAERPIFYKPIIPADQQKYYEALDPNKPNRVVKKLSGPTGSQPNPRHPRLQYQAYQQPNSFAGFPSYPQSVGQALPTDRETQWEEWDPPSRPLSAAAQTFIPTPKNTQARGQGVEGAPKGSRAMIAPEPAYKSCANGSSTSEPETILARVNLGAAREIKNATNGTNEAQEK